ncbi:MAG: malto-oligosyltrehalose trehalohydrolase [Cuniculiplasma sp.]
MKKYTELGANFNGTSFDITIWAPLHHKLFFHPINGKAKEMKKEGEYFNLKLENEKSGDLYRLNVDGKLLPDPLSRFQPSGIDGPSMLYDLTGYKRSVDKWKIPFFKELIIYEMHIGTFTEMGTYGSAENRLEYLKDLGITAIEIMPLSQTYGSRNWGYDGVFPFAPSYSYGKPEELMHFIDKCHSLDIVCLLDVVYNHLGPVGNVFPQYGPYLSQKYRTPWGETINFDGAFSGGVREMLLANASYWIEAFRFDGFRFDSTQNIYDLSIRHILAEINEYLEDLSKKLGRNILRIAETDRNDISLLRPERECGLGFNAMWADDLHHSFHSYVTGEKTGYYSDYGKFEDISHTLENGFLYNGKYSEYLKVMKGGKFKGMDSRLLVVSLQNHDQVGNRAMGERISSLTSFQKLKLGASLFILSPFTPMLFMGEEYGEKSPFWFFMQTDDMKFADVVNKGRRNEFNDFNWPDKISDPADIHTFHDSKLKWNHGDINIQMITLYRDLIRLRKKYISAGKTLPYGVKSENTDIHIDYPMISMKVIHHFSDQRLIIEGNILLNTSLQKYGGTNNDKTIMEEPGSMVFLTR